MLTGLRSLSGQELVLSIMQRCVQGWREKLTPRLAAADTAPKTSGAAAPTANGTRAEGWQFGADLDFRFSEDGEAQPSVAGTDEMQARALLDR